MIRLFVARLAPAFLFPAILLASSTTISTAQAQNRSMYSPLPLQAGAQLSDNLSAEDIPTGEGGFARDYVLQLDAGDQIAIDLASDEFDTIVSIISENGATVAENDDGPDGSTNSLLFTRITQAGSYIVRVRAFGETVGGPFKLKVTRLRPVESGGGK